MIEINLLPGQKKKKRAGMGFKLPDVGELISKVRDPLLLGAIGAWTVSGLAVGLLFFAQSRKLGALEEDLTRVQAEARRFAALIEQKRKAEDLRDLLVAELEVIRGIDADRYVWPHVLEEVTKALPDYTWLVGVEVLAAQTVDADTLGPQPVRFQLDGRTADIQAYTRFLRQLANSPWVSNIVAGATQTVVEDDRPVTAFSLTGQFRQADSAYIRTAPLLETVR